VGGCSGHAAVRSGCNIQQICRSSHWDRWYGFCRACGCRKLETQPWLQGLVLVLGATLLAHSIPLVTCGCHRIQGQLLVTEQDDATRAHVPFCSLGDVWLDFLHYGGYHYNDTHIRYGSPPLPLPLSTFLQHPPSNLASIAMHCCSTT